MSLQWPANLFTSGGSAPWTVAQPCGLPEFISPIPGFTTGFIFTQKFMQLLENWTPGVLNSAHPSAGLTPDYSAWYLVSEGKRRDLEHGVVEWERVYSMTPVTHDEYETFAYNFIGYVGLQFSTLGGTPVVNGGILQGPYLADGTTPNPDAGVITAVSSPIAGGASWTAGRARFTRAVTSRVSHDYFKIAGADAWDGSLSYLVGNIVRYAATTSTYVCIAAVAPTATTPNSDPTHWTLISTYDYATPGDIPSLTEQLYVNTNYVAAYTGLYTDFLMDNIGGLTATVPSTTTYSAWVTNAGSYGFSGGVAPGGTNPSQIIAEDSRLSRWQGNIWLRQTRTVLAQ